MINHEECITSVNQIKFKTSVMRSNLCDYSDTRIRVRGTIKAHRTASKAANNANKKIIFKSCVPFTNCISEINNTQLDDAHDIDVVMPIYNLIEYSDNYSKTSRSLWLYYRWLWQYLCQYLMGIL